MAKRHSRHTVIILNGSDLSTYCDTSSWEDTSEKQQTTTYGADRHGYDYGLGDGKLSMGGFYDTSRTAGPKAVIEAIKDAEELVTLVRRVEGTGSGRPQESVSVLVEKYTESAPVADYVKWTCDLQMSGDITRTVQP